MAPKAKSTALADIHMVASHSHDSPSFRAPHIQLNPTRDGLRAFMIKFHAILSPDLSNTLDNYLDNPRAPKTEEAKSAHKAIWRALVPCLNGLDDLLLRIHRDCRQHDGPQALFWLIKDLDDNAPVTSIKAVVDIIKAATFGGDIVSGIDHIISTNARLQEPFQFNNAITSILILVKLPNDLARLRDSLIGEINEDNIPSPRTILERVKQELSLRGLGERDSEHHISMATFQRNHARLKCINCDATGAHQTWACPKPKADCSECGPGAGHLSKFCFVKNDNPLPAGWSEARKADMQKQRSAYIARTVATGNVANFCVEADEEMDTEAFWKAIQAK